MTRYSCPTEEWLRKLEKALAEYALRYGLTDLAREALSSREDGPERDQSQDLCPANHNKPRV